VGDNRWHDGRPGRASGGIEDEQPVREAVLDALVGERFAAAGFGGLPGPGEVLALVPDLAILNVLLPGGNGFGLARSLRRERDLAIIFLTAGAAVADRVAGRGPRGSVRLPR
jgi:DNA-binding response OmpR family regulator